MNICFGSWGAVAPHWSAMCILSKYWCTGDVGISGLSDISCTQGHVLICVVSRHLERMWKWLCSLATYHCSGNWEGFIQWPKAYLGFSNWLTLVWLDLCWMFGRDRAKITWCRLWTIRSVQLIIFNKFEGVLMLGKFTTRALLWIFLSEENNSCLTDVKIFYFTSVIRCSVVLNIFYDFIID